MNLRNKSIYVLLPETAHGFCFRKTAESMLLISLLYITVDIIFVMPMVMYSRDMTK